MGIGYKWKLSRKIKCIFLTIKHIIAGFFLDYFRILTFEIYVLIYFIHSRRITESLDRFINDIRRDETNQIKPLHRPSIKEWTLLQITDYIL